jgi:hypothetical protein
MDIRSSNNLRKTQTQDPLGFKVSDTKVYLGNTVIIVQ